jgi:hypothetical protein
MCRCSGVKIGLRAASASAGALREEAPQPIKTAAQVTGDNTVTGVKSVKQSHNTQACDSVMMMIVWDGCVCVYLLE